MVVTGRLSSLSVTSKSWPCAAIAATSAADVANDEQIDATAAATFRQDNGPLGWQQQQQQTRIHLLSFIGQALISPHSPSKLALINWQLLLSYRTEHSLLNKDADAN